MPIHETISGHRVEYDEPEGELAKFMKRVRKAAKDPSATDDDLVTLIYGADNPLLSPWIVPGLRSRGMVTKETLAHPLYSVMQDLLLRKRIAERGIDVEAMAARHTISVSEAAARLGVHTSAIRQAIKSDRLASWVKDGQYYMTESALAAFELARRGPKPKGRTLRICAGSVPGRSFRVKSAGHEVTGKKGRVYTAEIPAWNRVAVISGGGGNHRFFELEPVTSGTERIGHGEFYVEGPFRVVRKINNPREADRAWKAFEPA